MPSTHISLHYHIVFSTKNREPLITSSWRERFHGYLGGVVKNLGGVAETVGGVADHVHILLGLRATHRVADIVRDLKSNSSRWAQEEIHVHHFQWQEGYGAFTVSPSQRETVRDYIARQEEHHRRRTFQEEYVELLDRCGVEYDSKYLW
jgi:REP element-mobilizing transposase RayT